MREEHNHSGGDRRREIVRDAACRFSRDGYHAISMRELSRAQGMTAGNLYHYFADKEEILFACHQAALDALEDLVRRVAASGAGPAEALAQLIAGQVRVIAGEPGGSGLMLEVDALSPEHRQIVVARRDASCAKTRPKTREERWKRPGASISAERTASRW